MEQRYQYNITIIVSYHNGHDSFRKQETVVYLHYLHLCIKTGHKNTRLGHTIRHNNHNIHIEQSENVVVNDSISTIDVNVKARRNHTGIGKPFFLIHRYICHYRNKKQSP